MLLRYMYQNFGIIIYRRLLAITSGRYSRCVVDMFPCEDSKPVTFCLSVPQEKKSPWLPPNKLYYSKTKTNWQLRAELKTSSTMQNFHIRALFFVMDSTILHIILKVKLNLFHSILY